MRSGSSTSSSRRTLAALVGAIVLSLSAADWWLYNQAGFTRTFGEDSHDGQDLSKLRRAQAFARDADIIVFGGSYARYGVSSRPFMAADILEWNFAVSGGGPVSSYFALDSVAPILASRAVKPIVVLELYRDPLVDGHEAGPSWAELVHTNGLARSRLQLLRNYHRLAPMAREFGVLTELVTQTVLPSSVLRKYVQLVVARGNVQGHWWGADDDFGYAPIQDVQPRPAGIERRPMTLAEASPTKLAYLVAFVDKAESLGTPLVILSSAQAGFQDATVDRYQAVYDFLARKYSNTRFVPMRDLGLNDDDFGADGWGHPNVRGADKISRSLIRTLNLKGDPAGFRERYSRLFDPIVTPPMTEWRGSFTPRVDRGATAFEYDALPQQGSMIAGFHLPAVPAGTEVMAEADVLRETGAVGLCLSPASLERPECGTDTTSLQTPGIGKLDRTRVYVRYRSEGQPLAVTFNAAWPNSKGRVESIRVVADKAGRMTW